jgi:DNA polymerase/3'-5' exonuclease PolX
VIAVNLFGQQQDTLMQNSDSLPDKVYFIQQVERNGVVMPEIVIREVTITGGSNRATARDYRRNERLIYNIKKVYPYALIARDQLTQINSELESLGSDRARRAYINEVEKKMFADHKSDIMKLTVTQGKILIKLIDRETQNTSFELIRIYRGGISAAFWQGIARLFGSNLKAEYDRFGEDAEIEIIVMEIEMGYL